MCEGQGRVFCGVEGDTVLKDKEELERKRLWSYTGKVCAEVWMGAKPALLGACTSGSFGSCFMSRVAFLTTADNRKTWSSMSYQLTAFPKSSCWIVADLNHLSYKHLWAFLLRWMINCDNFAVYYIESFLPLFVYIPKEKIQIILDSFYKQKAPRFPIKTVSLPK